MLSILQQMQPRNSIILIPPLCPLHLLGCVLRCRRSMNVHAVAPRPRCGPCGASHLKPPPLTLLHRQGDNSSTAAPSPPPPPCTAVVVARAGGQLTAQRHHRCFEPPVAGVVVPLPTLSSSLSPAANKTNPSQTNSLPGGGAIFCPTQNQQRLTSLRGPINLIPSSSSPSSSLPGPSPQELLPCLPMQGLSL
jgi:hypothetical protein